MILDSTNKITSNIYSNENTINSINTNNMNINTNNMNMNGDNMAKLNPLNSMNIIYNNQNNPFGRPRSLSEMSAASTVSEIVGMTGVWFYSNGLGTTYQITDNDGRDVLYLGTLCQDAQVNMYSGGKCNINLNPGCYIFRVDGAFDPDIDRIAWNFCGTNGGAQTQLNFCVEKNLQCKATSTSTFEEMCRDMVTDLSSTTLSISGTFHLGGMKVAELTEKDTLAIQNALIKEFSDASDSPNKKGVVEISKLSWERADPHVSELSDDTTRRLDYSGFTTSITFEVKLLAERFGINTIDDTGMKKLHHHMNNYLSKSMSTGIFTTKLVHAANTVKSKNLESVLFAKLRSLKVSQHKIRLNNNISILANIIIIGSVFLGFIFSILTYRYLSSGSIGYDNIMAEENVS